MIAIRPARDIGQDDGGVFYVYKGAPSVSPSAISERIVEEDLFIAALCVAALEDADGNLDFSLDAPPDLVRTLHRECEVTGDMLRDRLTEISVSTGTAKDEAVAIFEEASEWLNELKPPLFGIV